MAKKIYDLQLAGFTSGGNPSTGTGLIASKAIELWDDGSLFFTNAAGVRKQLRDNPEFNTLLAQLVQGGSGVSSTKKFHTT